MILEGDELDTEEKAKLERDIIAAGGNITNDIGIKFINLKFLL